MELDTAAVRLRRVYIPPCACGSGAEVRRFGMRSLYICCQNDGCYLETNPKLSKIEAIKEWERIVDRAKRLS